MTGEEEIKTSEIYHVVSIQNKRDVVIQLAQRNLERRQSQIEEWYDRLASKKSLHPGDRTWENVCTIERTVSRS